jgi:CRP-like cAMP-binding protein
MARSDLSAVPPSANRLLAALPPREFQQLRPFLERTPLPARVILQEPDRPIGHVHFPTSGIVSLLSAPGGSGLGVEVGIVGCEGMVGLPVFLGRGEAQARWLVQVPGESLRMRADAFRARVGRNSRLHELLLLYTHVFLAQVSLALACNSLHAVERRLARWLLTVQARVGEDRFPLTHQFLAAMLGVRRATVTEAALVLQAAQLIRYKRGQLMVLDRDGLEAASCGCHRGMQSALDWLPA